MVIILRELLIQNMLLILSAKGAQERQVTCMIKNIFNLEKILNLALPLISLINEY